MNEQKGHHDNRDNRSHERTRAGGDGGFEIRVSWGKTRERESEEKVSQVKMRLAIMSFHCRYIKCT